MLWSLLFVIPGIVKSYAYSMSYFIKADHPEIKLGGCGFCSPLTDMFTLFPKDFEYETEELIWFCRASLTDLEL